MFSTDADALFRTDSLFRTGALATGAYKITWEVRFFKISDVYFTMCDRTVINTLLCSLCSLFPVTLYIFLSSFIEERYI